jgi:hypothetical protein
VKEVKRTELSCSGVPFQAGLKEGTLSYFSERREQPKKKGFHAPGKGNNYLEMSSFFTV